MVRITYDRMNDCQNYIYRNVRPFLSTALPLTSDKNAARLQSPQTGSWEEPLLSDPASTATKGQKQYMKCKGKSLQADSSNSKAGSIQEAAHIPLLD